jgi:hypothetical protein
MDGTTPDLPTTSPTRFRRTRIAASVVFGVVTVLLLVMWVRSYFWRETIIDVQTARTIGSNNGYAFYSQFHFPNIATPFKRWVYNSTDVSPLPADFAWESIPEKTVAKVPYWFLTIPSLMISVACGFPYATRFSLLPCSSLPHW